MTRMHAKFKRMHKKRREKDEVMLKEAEYTKLSRKLRIMENDRRNYAQDVNNVLRKQGKEIHVLGRENGEMLESLSVAYGKFHLSKDVENTKRLKEFLSAREDYEQLVDVETSSCRELDVKIDNLQGQINAMKRQMGGEDALRDKNINMVHYIQKLENRVNKLTKDFCSQLYDNGQMKEKIKVLMKEKNIYQELYNKLTDKIAAYKTKIMEVTQEASSHYEHRLEAMSKMKTLKERSSKDEAMFQAEMKVLQRMVTHYTKLKEFMNTKENERLTFKAEEAEKRAKMSVKEKVLNEEAQHVQKFERLFENVREVTGHADLERVVHEFTTKDEENFARFDYVSELNHDVEKLRENIQLIRDNIKRLKDEDAQMQTGCENTLIELKKTKSALEQEIGEEQLRQAGVDEKLEITCGAVHLLFKRISCNTDSFKMSLAFEDRVTDENLKTYLGIIEQRFMELICIMKFIGLHQDHHGNLLRAPRSIHRIRPRGPSKILLGAVEQPLMPSINTPNIMEDSNIDGLECEDSCVPMDIESLREKAMKKIAKKEAAGLLNQPLFAQDKRRPKPTKKK